MLIFLTEAVDPTSLKLEDRWLLNTKKMNNYCDRFCIMQTPLSSILNYFLSHPHFLLVCIAI